MSISVGIAYANCGINPEVYRICESTYRYLEEKGFNLNSSGLPDLLRFAEQWQGDEAVSQDLAFPSFFQTICNLTHCSTRSDAQRERLWPTTIFFQRFNDSHLKHKYPVSAGIRFMFYFFNYFN